MNITQENYSNKLKELRSQSIHERDTQTVLELFFVFNNWDDERIRKSGSRLNSPYVYQFEISLGKKIFEMNSDELLEMIKGMKGKISGYISYNTYRGFRFFCNNVWKYYINNIEPTMNPWSSKNLQVDSVVKLLALSKPKITKDFLEETIENARLTYPANDPHYEYCEMFVRILYDGVESVREALSIAETQIDFDKKIIHFSYKEVYLSDRSIELLKYCHNLEGFVVYRETLTPVSYNGSYIPVIVKKNFKDSINARPIDSVSQSILNSLKIFMDKELSVKQIYKLGYFDFMVSRIGEEAIRNIVSENNREDNRTLIRLSAEYGYPVQTTAGIRNDLREFL